MKKVGILGGTFNPPHIGHLIMANEALHGAGLDEVRFMPNFIAPHKEVEGAEAAQRLRMTELAAATHPKFRVETIEIDSGGVSYSVDTMKKLKKREPDVDFHFIIGGDMIDELGSWHKIEELVKLVTFLGLERPGFPVQSLYPVRLIEAPTIELSSTLLRNRIKNGGSIAFLVPQQVEEFIRKEQLYGK